MYNFNLLNDEEIKLIDDIKLVSKEDDKIKIYFTDNSFIGYKSDNIYNELKK